MFYIKFVQTNRQERTLQNIYILIQHQARNSFPSEKREEFLLRWTVDFFIYCG